MRMQSSAGEDPVMLLGNLQRAIICPRPGAAADGQNALQSGFTRACEHICAIRIEFVAVNVGVRVNVHQLFLKSRIRVLSGEGSLPSKMQHGASERCMVDLKVLKV